MGSGPFPETSCILCSKPLDLRSDLNADEHGKAVHEECYVSRIKSAHSNPSVAAIAD
jgi:hypothetical protein